MKKLLPILFLISSFGCTNSRTDEQQRISKLESELASKNERISELEQQLVNTDTNSEPEYWYAFKPTTEYNIVKLSNVEAKVIDKIELVDSVDIVYTFEHTTTISQLDNDRLSSFFQNYNQFNEVLHRSGGYGPMVEGTDYNVRVFVVCEEDGLPIESENCTDNVYILVQPTELGYENNLFKISRLFGTEIKSLINSKDGVVLTLEHSRFPRKELNILIKPQLAKFLN